jgi:hypothetical protein
MINPRTISPGIVLCGALSKRISINNDTRTPMNKILCRYPASPFRKCLFHHFSRPFFKEVTAHSGKIGIMAFDEEIHRTEA